MRLAGSVSRNRANAWPELTSGTANVAVIWMMPPSSRAPMTVRQPTSLSHLGNVGIVSPARQALDRGQRLGAALVHRCGPGSVLHGQDEVDPAAADRQPVARPRVARQRDDRPAVCLPHN